MLFRNVLLALVFVYVLSVFLSTDDAVASIVQLSIGHQVLRVHAGVRLREQCGVITAAAYFPGFHESVDNNMFWGKGWTEWDNIRNITYDPVAKQEIRLPYGEYDISDPNVIYEQAELAASRGVGAFMFYSYWFEHGRKALNVPLENALLKNKKRLGVSFFFSWANEPWTRRWNGKNDKDAFIRQAFGNSYDWKKHFDYLQKFFEHPDYLHIDGKPVFVIYRPDLIKKAPYQDDLVVLSKEDSLCPGPGGCVAARLYLDWYKKDLADLSPENAFNHWETVGKGEGRTWPEVEEAESEADRKARMDIMNTIDPTANVFEKMMRFFQIYSREKGFKDGVYIVGTQTPMFIKSFSNPAFSILDAGVQFMPNSISRGHSCDEFYNRSCECISKVAIKFSEQDLVPKRVHQGTLAYNRGAFITWSNYPRHRKDPQKAVYYCTNPNGPAFQELLATQLNRSIGDTNGCKKPVPGSINRFVLINAWNEWGEQAVLEPNQFDGDLFLRHHEAAIQSIEDSL